MENLWEWDIEAVAAAVAAAGAAATNGVDGTEAPARNSADEIHGRQMRRRRRFELRLAINACAVRSGRCLRGRTRRFTSTRVDVRALHAAPSGLDKPLASASSPFPR